MVTDTEFIVESISQGCVMLADGEFFIDRLVKYVGNGRIRWHVEFRGHRIELTTGQLKKQPTFRRKMLEQAGVLPPQCPGANYRRWVLDLRRNAIELPWRERPVDAGFSVDRLVGHGGDRWTVEYQGKAIKFTTTKLRRQTSFRKRMLLKAKVLPPRMDPVAYRKWVDWLIQNAAEVAPRAGDAVITEKSWLDDLPELGGWQDEAAPEATD
ncbi:MULTISPECIES: hypothetical protein [Mesorhizobium]|uniref:Uncharacterized protein n=1 Tax=Mesorhizobium australicum (strain HAMBI 3006 / LMG 24608 / WSM2073) TaxID=754035 RepID=L0KQF8_MESAW|nr:MULTISPECIES: hypothetical protein [Mesorhizobium]AGB46915.1 hypothetical protein Mesau_04586 [Mesorhizobium australicum WSM2073]MBZ9694385.1 hypothetical protein [Mesorhizobium sp. CO1-1-9]MBZ9722945.1 hypothetical protein [Mesorhizobium sp. CO1-1-11]MBZ9974708.1 hypothetical protein [Mesorhizobium sp. BR-1-1-10]